MRQARGMMQLPSGAHRDLLPLILPLLLSFASTPLSPTHVLSPPTSEPPSSACWLAAVTIDPEEEKKNKRSKWNARLKQQNSVPITKCREIGRMENQENELTSANSFFASSSGQAGKPPQLQPPSFAAHQPLV